MDNFRKMYIICALFLFLSPVSSAPSSKEKACVDLCDPQRNLHEVYLVVDDGRVHFDEKPMKNCPAVERLWENPRLGRQAANSAFILEWKCNRCSAFNVAPGVAMTAGHCFAKYEEGDRIRGSRASYVNSQVFESDGFDCELLWHADNVRRRYKGDQIPSKGSDLAIIADFSKEKSFFILPCSYDYVLSRGLPKSIVVYSFPCVPSFMQQARLQLRDGKPPPSTELDIWKLHKPVMEIRGKMQNTKQNRLELYSLLENAFVRVSNGGKAASLGDITCHTDIAISGRYSTLKGSSGAPLCPLALRGYFIAVHNSGPHNLNGNFATSCDNPKFVEEYVRLVVPHLPCPSDPVWKDRDLDPFEHWVNKHGIVCGKLRTLFWEHKMRRNCKTQLKRKRDYA